MDIAAVNATASSSKINAPNTAKIGGDFSTFLNMLTVQLKNQDPLSPMESSEFAVQLATFSAVEQQAHTNELLTSYLQENGGGLAGYADLIGKPVRVSGSAFLGGAAVEMKMPGSSIADTATLIVSEENGEIVATRALDPTEKHYLWEPLPGAPLTAGTYSVAVRYSNDGQESGTEKVSTISHVKEITSTDGETELVLANGMRLPPADISAVLSSG